MILIYLAAGRGSRLPKEFRNNPKCLVEVKNKTLFERNKEFFNFFKKKIIITGYKKNKIQKLAKKMNFKIIHNKYYIKTNRAAFAIGSPMIKFNRCNIDNY